MGIKIATDAIKHYVDALGKQSILQTKNSFKPDKSSYLGWVRPDGNISFADTKNAIKYARATILKDLNAAVPKERSVVVKDNLVTYSKLGTELNCTVPTNAEGIWFHGHPSNQDGSVNTFSTMDYRVLFNCPKLEAAVVYNKDGESTMMKKLPLKYGKFSKLLLRFLPQNLVNMSIIGGRLGWLDSVYAKLVCNLNDEALNKKLRAAARKQIWAKITGNAKNSEKYQAEYNKYANEQLVEFNTLDGAKKMDKMWQNNQQRLGIEYDMNFANLKD